MKGKKILEVILNRFLQIKIDLILTLLIHFGDGAGVIV